MFVGTGSDVGKSIINAAFCRIFLQDGYFLNQKTWGTYIRGVTS